MSNMETDRDQSHYTSNIRPLDAEEYYEILADSDVELRISDGTGEGTWRFWTDHGRLFYRRLNWFENKTCDTQFMQNIIDGDGMTQLVTGGSDD